MKCDTAQQISVSGTLDANGTVDNPVVFTSIKDDSYGGDTNGDSTTTSPAVGDWQGIFLYGEYYNEGIGEFDYCRIRYGGNTSGDADANVKFASSDSGHFTNSISEYSANYGVYVRSCSPTIDSSTMTNNTGDGLYVSGGTPTITSNTFTDNGGYPILLSGVTLTPYSGNSISGHAINSFVITGSVRGTWSNYFPFVLDGTVVVNNNMNLTMTAGTIAKGASGSELKVYGTLDVNGTSTDSVIFTSLKDDSYGGDTNGDSTTTSPAAGDWRGIMLYKKYSSYQGIGEFDYCRIRYGGRNAPGGADANVKFESSDFGHFTNSISEQSDNYGIYVYNCSPTFRENRVEDNTSYGIYIRGNSTPDLGANDPADKGWNNIRGNDNGNYQVYNASSNTINAYYNLWEYATAAEIDAHIRDDEEGGGEVLFDPWIGPPVLSALPDTSFHEDEKLDILMDFFYPYVYDPDHADSTLIWTFTDTDYVAIIISGDTLKLTADVNWNGIDTISVITSNTVFSDTASWVIKVTPMNDAPHVAEPLLDVTIDEDDFGAIVIPRLEVYFADVDTNDHLSFSGLTLDAGLDSLSTGSGDGMAFAQRFSLGRISPGLSSKKRTVLSVKRSQVKIEQNKLFIDGKLPNRTFNPEIKTTANVNGIYSSFSRQTRADTTALIVYPTEDFNGGIRIVVTATDDSSALVSDTLLLTVMPINDLPVLTALTDTSMSEDDTLLFALSAYDLDGDTLIFSAESDTSAISTIITDTLLTVIPFANWNGVTQIIVGVSDNDTTVTSQFALTVVPVNDAPGAFELVSPIDNTIIELTNDNLGENLTFEWQSSIDVDGDTITYSVHFTNDLEFFSLNEIQETEVSIMYDSMLSIMNSTALTILEGTWTVFAYDEVDSTLAANGPFSLIIDGSQVSVTDEVNLPAVYALHQNFPNPFNPITTIRYDLPEQTYVNITIYDLIGRQVESLVNQTQEAGYKLITWNSGKVSSGMYIYRIKAGDFTQTKKMVLLK